MLLIDLATFVVAGVVAVASVRCRFVWHSQLLLLVAQISSRENTSTPQGERELLDEQKIVPFGRSAGILNPMQTDVKIGLGIEPATFHENADVGRFIPLAELTDKLGALQNSLIASATPENRLKLRGKRNRPERESWHAILFARAYECYFRLDGMCVRIEPEENSAHDATLRWTENNVAQELKVQLKELPSESLNAHISLRELLAKSIEKYPPSKDLTLAFFIGRNLPQGQVEIPDHQLAGLWIFGFTGIGKPEFISLVGIDEKGEHSNCKKFIQ